MKTQPGGLQSCDGIDEPISHARPVAVGHGLRLRRELKSIAAILQRPVIENKMTPSNMIPPGAPLGFGGGEANRKRYQNAFGAACGWSY